MTASAETTLGRRDRKKLQTRAALVEAALRLAAERGLDRVTVEDISEAADVSSRTFFNYFSGKDEAIVDGHLADQDLIRERFAAVPRGVTVLEAVLRAVAPVVEQMQQNRDQWLLRMRVVRENPALMMRLVAGGAAAERAMTEAVAARIGVGPDHPYPPLVVAVTSAAYRAAMMRWASGRARRPLADLVDEAFAALAGGLVDPDPTPPPHEPRRHPRAVRPSMKDAA